MSFFIVFPILRPYELLYNRMAMNEALLKAIMYLLVGIAVLLCGMRFMSGGLKKIAGRGLRRFFKRTQNSPFIGMGIGVAVTVVIQSSDATAALVIGFINAGVMTVYQGLTIMLGGYIGTTITGIIASFSSLPISVYLLSLAFIGTVLLFFSNEKVKNIGEILCGLGLIFFGLAVMKDAFANTDIRAFCTTLFSSINYPVLLFIIGAALAALAQSSSAITGIVIAMVGGGALDLNSAIYIALGATLGTVANTLLAAANGSIDGKRTAWIAFSMKLISSVTALIITMLLEQYIVQGLRFMQINGSDEFPLAMYTVIFNLIFMPLMLPLIKPLIALMSKIVKDKSDKAFASAVKFIDDNLLKSPDVALMQAQREIINMFDLSYENYQRGLGKIINYTNETSKQVIAVEGEIDYLNQRITDFLIKLAPLSQSRGERKIGAYFHVINDIERIGDHAFNFHETADELHNNDLSFSPAAVKEILQLDVIIKDMFQVAKTIFVYKDRKSLAYLRDQEEKVHQMKQDFYRNHYERIIKEECTQEMTPYISTLIVELERIADHLTNIGYSITNPTGEVEPQNISRPKTHRKHQSSRSR